MKLFLTVYNLINFNFIFILLKFILNNANFIKKELIIQIFYYFDNNLLKIL